MLTGNIAICFVDGAIVNVNSDHVVQTHAVHQLF